MGRASVDPDAFDAFEAAGWEEKAAAYERVFGDIAGRVVEPLLDAAAVGVGTRVLDVATGPGWVALQAAGRGASVVGVDVAQAMVERARSARPDLDFRRADAHDLPFADASFDAVVSNLAIMHFSRPERAMAEFARVLRPGGALALTAWAPHPSTGWSACSSMRSRKRTPSHLRISPEALTSSGSPMTRSSPRSTVNRIWRVAPGPPSRSCTASPVRTSSGTGCSRRPCGCPRSSRPSRRTSGAASAPRSTVLRPATGVVTSVELPVAVKLATARKPDRR